jgi:plasmid stabilization system protein ParE
MKRYVLTIEAQRDLVQIRDYVHQESGSRAARHVVASIIEGVRSLARTPGQGHRRDDLTDRTDLRFWPIMAFLIIYYADKRAVHCCRDSPRQS